jgi:dTDP-4-amino-4,6-dideoxy-D-glucose acyltransferase
VAATSFLTESEVAELGLGSCGVDVRISHRASIYNPERVHLGSHVRIDDFALLTTGRSGRIDVGNYVHIAAFAALYGAAGVTLGDYTSLSARVSVYTTNDDYGGDHLTNPTVPDEYRGVEMAPVTLGRHTAIGAHSVILPGVTTGEGEAVGALSLVRSPLDAWGVYAGVPVRLIRPRTRNLLLLEKAHRAAGDVVDTPPD